MTVHDLYRTRNNNFRYTIELWPLHSLSFSTTFQQIIALKTQILEEISLSICMYAYEL